MSLKTINHQATLHNEYSYTVVRDSEWNEFRIKFYIGGEYASNSDYHTDDKWELAERERERII